MLVPVVKAEDLPSFDWDTGKSDPYVEIRIVSVDVRNAHPDAVYRIKKTVRGLQTPCKRTMLVCTLCACRHIINPCAVSPLWKNHKCALFAVFRRRVRRRTKARRSGPRSSRGNSTLIGTSTSTCELRPKASDSTIICRCKCTERRF